MAAVLSLGPLPRWSLVLGCRALACHSSAGLLTDSPNEHWWYGTQVWGLDSRQYRNSARGADIYLSNYLEKWVDDGYQVIITRRLRHEQWLIARWHSAWRTWSAIAVIGDKFTHNLFRETDWYLRQCVSSYGAEHDKSHSGIVGPIWAVSCASRRAMALPPNASNQILVQTLQARFVACAFHITLFFYLFQLAPYGLGADQRLLHVWYGSFRFRKLFTEYSTLLFYDAGLWQHGCLFGRNIVGLAIATLLVSSLRRVDSKIRDAVIAFTNMTATSLAYLCRSPSSSS